MPPERIKHYRAIATASRKKLDRGRMLYARLVFRRLARDPFPKLVHHDAAVKAKTGGLYGSTAVCDVEFSLGLKWLRLLGLPRRHGNGWRTLEQTYRIESRYRAYDIEQERARRRDFLAARTQPAASLPQLPGGFWGE